ncbi:MAG: polyphosphate polymerase domain-containing protein [Armatimonadota bacterium]
MTTPTGVRRGWERKFEAPAGSEAHLVHALDALLARDRHGDGGYAVHSVYFDTPDLAVHRRCPIHGRAKLRIRRYGESSTVFLERKAKDEHGWVDKVRTELAADRLVGTASLTRSDVPDIQWFAALLAAGNFAPNRRIACRRTAWDGILDGLAMRVTLDLDIRAAPANGTLLPGPLPHGQALTDRPLLEIKGDAEFPATLERLLATLGATPVDFSKYRRSVELA